MICYIGTDFPTAYRTGGRDTLRSLEQIRSLMFSADCRDTDENGV